MDTSTYENAQEYIAGLNETVEWISYDPATNTATITNIADFVSHCKAANKNIGAFDALDGEQGENTLFGYGDGQGTHFDSIMADLLENSDYGSVYESNLTNARSQSLKQWGSSERFSEGSDSLSSAVRLEWGSSVQQSR